MKNYMALYMGSALGGPGPGDLSEETIAKGIAAWGDWMTRHAADIVEAGGPLGKTKKTAAGGVTDMRNAVTGYVVVRAQSHDAAAKMFEGHPHFTIFPGDSVEIMECLPIPGA
jgi:hypothetical protein